MFRRVGELIGAVAIGGSARRAIRGDGCGDQAPADNENERRRQRDRRPRVLLLEWLDPPYCSGHWNPEIIERAGGIEVLGKAGMKSRRATWDEVAASRPDVIIVSPCGFDLDRTTAELEALAARTRVERAWRRSKAGRVAVVDGSAYFSRPDRGSKPACESPPR